MKYTVTKSGCWKYAGCITASGYSRIWDKKLKKADWGHRVSYRLYRGPIPRGLSIDHLCRNRACINPEHLEAVTPNENVKRSSIVTSTINSKKTKCPRGHEYNAENSYIYTNKKQRVQRLCKICQIAWNNAHKEQRRQYYWKNRDRIIARRKERLQQNKLHKVLA